MVKEQEIDLGDLLNGALPPADTSDFVKARLIIDCHCDLGEGIIFDERKKAVLWTDILGSKFHMLQLHYDAPSKMIFSAYDLPKKLCSFGLLQEEKEGCVLPLLCGWEDGFQLYDMVAQKELSEMSKGEDVNPLKGPSRLNDGRVDPEGKRFICGGFYGDTPGVKMKVFKCEQIDGSLSHTPIMDEIEVANSTCWSPDGKSMYFADSPTKQICSHKYNSDDGTLSGKTVLHEKSVDEGSVPDGCIVDSEGFLWNAVWRAGMGPGMVQRIDPTSGKVVFTVHMPDSTSQVSCCCFGGENMDILFITSASEGRDKSKEPHAGGIYAIKLPFKGRHESRLQFSL